MKAPTSSDVHDIALEFRTPAGQECSGSTTAWPSPEWVRAFFDRYLGPGYYIPTFSLYDEDEDDWPAGFAVAPDHTQALIITAAVHVLATRAVHDEFGAVDGGNKKYPLGLLGTRTNRFSPRLMNWISMPFARALLRYQPITGEGQILTTWEGALLQNMYSRGATAGRAVDDHEYNPVIALASGDNPFLRLAFGSGGGTSVMVLALRGYASDLGPPESFVFPPNWATFAHLQLPAGTAPALRAGSTPESVQETLQDLGDSLRKAVEKLPEDYQLMQAALSASSSTWAVVGGIGGVIVGAYMVAVALLLIAGIMLFALRMKSKLDKLADVLDAVATALDRMVLAGSDDDGAGERYVSMVSDLRHLLELTISQSRALAEIMAPSNDEEDRLAVWMCEQIAGHPDDLRTLVSALRHRDGEWTYDAWAEWLNSLTHDYSPDPDSPAYSPNNPAYDPIEVSANGDPDPVLHLAGDRLQFRFTQYGGESFGSPDDYEAYVHSRWLAVATPSIEFARIIDVAADLLVLGAIAESPVMGLGPVMTSASELGRSIREQVFGAGPMVFDALDEVFPGVSINAVLKFMLRQALADTYIAAWESEGHDPRCLYEVFCWMTTERQRDVITAVLGDVPTTAEEWRLRTRTGGLMEQVFNAEGLAVLPAESDDTVRIRWRDLNNRSGWPSAAPESLSGRAVHDVWYEFVAMVREDCVLSTYESWYERAQDEAGQGQPPEDWEPPDVGEASRYAGEWVSVVARGATDVRSGDPTAPAGYRR